MGHIFIPYTYHSAYKWSSCHCILFCSLLFFQLWACHNGMTPSIMINMWFWSLFPSRIISLGPIYWKPLHTGVFNITVKIQYHRCNIISLFEKYFFLNQQPIYGSMASREICSCFDPCHIFIFHGEVIRDSCILTLFYAGNCPTFHK